MVKKIFYLILQSGIWMQPLFMYLLIGEVGWDRASEMLPLTFLPSLLFILWSNAGPSSKEGITGKEAAMYPQVNRGLLSRKPEGIILGKHKDDYMRKPLQEDGHIVIIGGSGSGKSSSVVIPSLLANPYNRFWVLDIKGELSFKATRFSDERVKRFNPNDRFSSGYNPFYALNENSNTQKVYEVMREIALSLIALPADLADPFWKTSARNLLTGLLIYYYSSGSKTFVSIVDEILSKPVRSSIAEAMSNLENSSNAYKLLVGFSEMPDETLGGVVSEMESHLLLFATDADIRYALELNPDRLTPKTIEDGYSVYIVIKEEKLEAYYDLLQLIINQQLSALEQRPEEAEPVVMLIDELPRILSAGKIYKLLDASRTLRSRKVTLTLVTQSVEALETAYSESEVTDLISNAGYVVVLSAKSTKTQKMVSEWCGKYRARKKSWSKGSTTTSFDEMDLVSGADLMELQNMNEAIIISPYGYNRIKKAPYYRDKYLSRLSEEYQKHNRTIIEHQKTNRGDRA